ncbi:MAG TPA: hypothetical protein VF749_11625, partial [Candidatus Acidoferrum sp.]
PLDATPQATILFLLSIGFLLAEVQPKPQLQRATHACSICSPSELEVLKRATGERLDDPLLLEPIMTLQLVRGHSFALKE